jgi:hypothetical protein
VAGFAFLPPNMAQEPAAIPPEGVQSFGVAEAGARTGRARDTAQARALNALAGIPLFGKRRPAPTPEGTPRVAAARVVTYDRPWAGEESVQNLGTHVQLDSPAAAILQGPPAGAWTQRRNTFRIPPDPPTPVYDQ